MFVVVVVSILYDSFLQISPIIQLSRRLSSPGRVVLMGKTELMRITYELVPPVCLEGIYKQAGVRLTAL